MSRWGHARLEQDGQDNSSQQGSGAPHGASTTEPQEEDRELQCTPGQEGAERLSGVPHPHCLVHSDLAAAGEISDGLRGQLLRHF